MYFANAVFSCTTKIVNGSGTSTNSSRTHEFRKIVHCLLISSYRIKITLQRRMPTVKIRPISGDAIEAGTPRGTLINANLTIFNKIAPELHQQAGRVTAKFSILQRTHRPRNYSTAIIRRIRKPPSSHSTDIKKTPRASAITREPHPGPHKYTNPAGPNRRIGSRHRLSYPSVHL